LTVSIVRIAEVRSRRHVPGESKSVEQVRRTIIRLLLTVCGNAKENCPIFPGNTTTIHHAFKDPAAFQGSDQDRLAFFR